MFQKGDPYKFLDLPLTNYASLSYDKVSRAANMVGFSTFSSYSYNERTMLSLAIMDTELSEVGNEVTLRLGRRRRRIVEANRRTP